MAHTVGVYLPDRFSWHAKGIPFKHHVYVPEVHPTTGIEFCEREDEGHVFKVSRLLLPIGYMNLHTYLAYLSVLATRWSTESTA